MLGLIVFNRAFFILSYLSKLLVDPKSLSLGQLRYGISRGVILRIRNVTLPSILRGSCRLDRLRMCKNFRFCIEGLVFELFGKGQCTRSLNAQ